MLEKTLRDFVLLVAGLKGILQIYTITQNTHFNGNTSNYIDTRESYDAYIKSIKDGAVSARISISIFIVG